MKPTDVYSYGVVSSSTLYRIGGAFPAPEGYAEIEDRLHMVGGEAANSSIVLAQLGARVRLDGNWLGDDRPGRRTRALLTDVGIDTDRLPLRSGYTGVSEVVFAARSTRTIFGTYGQLLEREEWNAPQEGDIAAARVVCLDPFFAQPALRVAQLASTAGIPVVTVDCRFDSALLGLASAVVISGAFLRDSYPGLDPADLFAKFRDAAGGLVIFTFGDASGWYARPGQPERRFRPYPVDAVDTSGAGDSFRAGIVYGLMQGWDDARTIDFAAALAAIVCTRFPGVMRAPGLDEVLGFLEARGRDESCS